MLVDTIMGDRRATTSFSVKLHRGSYMSAPVLLNLLNNLRKSDKMRGLPSILSLFFATNLINSIIQKHSCKFYLSQDIKIT